MGVKLINKELKMYKNKKVIGVTGPSIFSPEVKTMVEEYFGAICLYINQDKKEDLDYIIGQCDGIILAGGSDIHCMTLGRQVTRFDGLSKFDLLRDRRELYIIDKCVDQSKALFGICRGNQILGHWAGFYLMSDIGRSEISHSPASDDIKLNVEVGECAYTIECLPEFQDEWFDFEWVNSHHHQALLYTPKQKYLKGFNIIATADTSSDDKKNNKLIELMENKNDKIISCQWHPEEDYKFGNIASLKVLERFKEFLG